MLEALDLLSVMMEHDLLGMCLGIKNSASSIWALKKICSKQLSEHLLMA